MRLMSYESWLIVIWIMIRVSRYETLYESLFFFVRVRLISWLISLISYDSYTTHIYRVVWVVSRMKIRLTHTHTTGPYSVTHIWLISHILLISLIRLSHIRRLGCAHAYVILFRHIHIPTTPITHTTHLTHTTITHTKIRLRWCSFDIFIYLRLTSHIRLISQIRHHTYDSYHISHMWLISHIRLSHIRKLGCAVTLSTYSYTHDYITHTTHLTHTISHIPQTEEIGLKIITTAKISTNFSREFP